ncbi:MAG: PAS domain S-box protein [Desulfobacteraceae bacterium]|nr:PAS domain S-box protein [Desulfobacteraceae bacterium]
MGNPPWSCTNRRRPIDSGFAARPAPRQFPFVDRHIPRHCKSRKQLIGELKRLRSGIAALRVPQGDAAGVGLNRRIERANEAECRITGCSPKELKSRAFSDITHPEGRSLDLEYGSSLIAGKIERYKLEGRCIRKDGSIIWINLHVRVRLVRDLLGLPHRFISMMEDITGRKNAFSGPFSVCTGMGLPSVAR